jgi:DNA modification methylase
LERIICGEALEELKKLPDKIVQTCITSPPYWGLRDYGTASWKGGNPNCDHAVRILPYTESSTISGGKKTVGHQQEGFKTRCPRCGAIRVDKQIGLEETPEDFVASLVEVFREVKRVIRDDGTLWLNLGDSYNGSGGAGGDYCEGGLKEGQPKYPGRFVPTLKRKDLCMIPARVALALQEDGWYLRSDIIWSKPNAMPESVRDRPTKTHEYIYLLTKSEKYYYDAEAIREEPLTDTPQISWEERKAIGDTSGNREADRFNEITSKITFGTHPLGRNKRSVWTVPTRGFPGAHFAVFPPELIEPCVLAGSSDKACPTCYAPWERVVEKVNRVQNQKAPGTDWKTEEGKGRHGETSTLVTGFMYEYETKGWQPTCNCENNDGSAKSIVLDPFLGSGTTAFVAMKHRRFYIGIEMNPEYIKMVKERLGEVQVALF